MIDANASSILAEGSCDMIQDVRVVEGVYGRSIEAIKAVTLAADTWIRARLCTQLTKAHSNHGFIHHINTLKTLHSSDQLLNLLALTSSHPYSSIIKTLTSFRHELRILNASSSTQVSTPAIQSRRDEHLLIIIIRASTGKSPLTTSLMWVDLAVGELSTIELLMHATIKYVEDNHLRSRTTTRLSILSTSRTTRGLSRTRVTAARRLPSIGAGLVWVDFAEGELAGAVGCIVSRLL